MNIKQIHRGIVALAAAITAQATVLSCSYITDDADNCGIYLEFIYDYNMDYSDKFYPQVGTVDVFVFDSDDRYMFTEHAASEELEDNKRMLLRGDLRPGTYKVLTVGGLSEHFSVSDKGAGMSPGETMLEDVRIALERTSDIVSHEFSPLWVGETITIEYKADFSVWPVYMVKNTNRFNLLLAKSEGVPTQEEMNASHTFGIVTPEGAVYAHNNVPVVDETVIYTPYRLTPGENPGELTKGELNTARLLYGNDYRILVRTGAGQTLWDYDLLKLLEHIKPETRPADGSPLPIQEYLDRESEWNIVILYNGEVDPDDPEAFIAVAVRINGWLVWLHDIDV